MSRLVRDSRSPRRSRGCARRRRRAWSPTSPPAIPTCRAPRASCARSIAAGRRRARGRRAVLGPAGRRPGDPAGDRAGAGRRARRWPACSTCSARVRPDLRAPIVIFSYANPILRLGAERFADRARAAGVDGVLVLDLPIEEAGEFRGLLAARGIDTILLLSPTTTDERLRQGGGPRQRLSLRDFAARRDRRARPDRRRRRGDGAAHPARQRPAGGPGVRHLEAGARARSRPAGPTPPWSAARSSASSPRRARRTISTRGSRSMCVG